MGGVLLSVFFSPFFMVCVMVGGYGSSGYGWLGFSVYTEPPEFAKHNQLTPKAPTPGKSPPPILPHRKAVARPVLSPIIKGATAPHELVAIAHHTSVAPEAPLCTPPEEGGGIAGHFGTVVFGRTTP